MNNGWKLNEEISQPRIRKSSNAGAVPRQKALSLETEFPTVGDTRALFGSWGAGKGSGRTKTLLDHTPFSVPSHPLGLIVCESRFPHSEEKGSVAFTLTMFPSSNQTGLCREELVPRAGFHPSPS